MARTALFSPSVLSSAASGYRLPTRPVALAFMEACSGDRAEWELRWPMLQGHADQRPKRSRAVMGVAAPAPVLVSPAQLPIGPNDFVGRTAELAGRARVVSPLADNRLPLLVSGPVGAGKTAFALRLAHEFAADFPDGQLYADTSVGRLAGTSPFDVIGGFLSALGVPPGKIPADHTHRTGLVRSMLARWRVIVLLDDVRDEGQVRPLLARSMRSQILVTSRARLLGLDGVRRTELDVFTRSESMELIRSLVGDERIRAEREAHIRLAELCDDLPLAVTIAGRKFAAQPGRSVLQIIRQLAEETHRIQWLRVSDMNLRTALTSAYLRLTPMARRVFHQLGCCGAEGATASDLARPMKIAINSAEHMLETLVDCGLLSHPPRSGRYVMSTLVGMFAENQLSQLRDSNRYADCTPIQVQRFHTNELAKAIGALPAADREAVIPFPAPSLDGDRWGKGASCGSPWSATGDRSAHVSGMCPSLGPCHRRRVGHLPYAGATSFDQYRVIRALHPGDERLIAQPCALIADGSRSNGCVALGSACGWVHDRGSFPWAGRGDLHAGQVDAMELNEVANTPKSTSSQITGSITFSNEQIVPFLLLRVPWAQQDRSNALLTTDRALEDKVRHARRRLYLMCRPTYFDVEYSINPWMNPSKPISRELAMARWQVLRDLVVSLGHRVDLIEPLPSLPRMVFAANRAVVLADRAVVARFRYPQRAGEAPAYLEWVRSKGYAKVCQKHCQVVGCPVWCRVSEPSVAFSRWTEKTHRRLA